MVKLINLGSTSLILVKSLLHRVGWIKYGVTIVGVFSLEVNVDANSPTMVPEVCHLVTLFNFILGARDFYEINFVDGYNVPISIDPCKASKNAYIWPTYV
jgi:hypothetical protein